MKKIFIFIALIFIYPAFGKSLASWKKLDVSTSMKSIFVDSEVAKARIQGFYLGVDSEAKLTEKSDFFLSATASFEVGSNEVIGTIAEYEPEESIDLDQAGIIHSLTDDIKLEFGALSQAGYHSPLLVAASPFAAFKQTLRWGSFFASAQQAIPSNNYLAKRVGTIETGTPFFRMETIGLTTGSKNIFNAHISHFSYRDLSNNIAEKSQVFGNSVAGLGNSTKFQYGFDGYNLVLNSSFVVSHLQLILGGEYLYNDKAPEKRNRGSILTLGIKGNSYGIGVESFRNESDTSPSFYNSKIYGHNNMQGHALVGNYYGTEYLAKFRLSQMNPIEDNSVQAKGLLVSFHITKIVSFLTSGI